VQILVAFRGTFHLQGADTGEPEGDPHFEGGNPPRSDACEAQAQHGYFGIELEVVDDIIQWIRAPHAA
jgi:hypothetical protein